MWSALVVGSVLSLGQPTAAGDQAAPPTPASAPVPAAPAAPAPDRWPLMKILQGTYPGWLLDGNKVQISGWVEGAYTASSACQENEPIGFDYKANQFLLQQQWLRIARPVDPNATTPTFGFQSDTILPGSDARYTLARGLFYGQTTSNNGGAERYPIDPIQFYAEAYLPQVARGMDVKFGRFFSQFGVESNDTTQNQLFSHSYLFFYNPFTHTGLLTTTKLTDAWSVQNGLVTGSDVFIDPVATPTYIGSVKWAPPNGRDSATVSVIFGSGRYNQDRMFNNPRVFDLVATHKFSDRLTYTVDALFEYQTNVPDLGTATSFGVAQYLTYTFTPRLSGTTRLEFYDDAQGQRTGFKGLYTALTAALSYRPVKYLLLRPELRFDYNGESRPFEDRHELFTAAMDAVFRY